MRSLQITQNITNRSALVEKYLDDINRIDMISAQEEVILAQKIKAGDQAALQKLCKANLRFVVSVAKKYQHQGLPLADLICEGNLGLITAAQKFDETRGFKFISMAVWWIRQNILAAISEHARTVRLPLNKIHEITKINRAAQEVERQTLREATPEQVAEQLGMTEERVSHALAQAKWTVTIDTVYGEEEFSLLDRLPDYEFAADKSVQAEGKFSELRMILHKLSPRERTIIELSYGLTGQLDMNPVDIAPIVGLSTERVRQIRKAALSKLRHELN